MMNILGCIGIGVSLTIAAFSGIGINLNKNSSVSTEVTSGETANCSLTSVQICRSQKIDPHTGTVISVSNLKRN